MYKTIALALALVLAACGGAAQAAEASLEGSWKLSTASIDEMLEEVPEAQRAQARPMFDEMKMAFVDGKCIFDMPIVGKKEGTYSIKSSDGNELTIETEMDGVVEEKAIVMDGDEFTIDLEGKNVSFVRAE